MKTSKPATSGKLFTKFPHALARMKLPLRTKVVAAWLMSYGRASSRIYPSQERVGDELNLSVRAVRDSIRELEKAKLFKSHRVGNTCTNRYYPSKALAAMFDYQGETIETAPSLQQTEVTGKNRTRDRQKPAGTATKFAGLDKQNSLVDKGIDSVQTKNDGESIRQCSDIDDTVLLNSNGQTDQHPAFDEICRSRIGHGYVSALNGASVEHALIPWDVYGETAEYLVKNYEDRILRQVNWLPYRFAQKPSGMLIIAIEQNYTPPQDMTPEEVAEVEQLIAERKFYMPPHMAMSPVPHLNTNEATLDHFEEGCTNCDDPTCSGCVQF